MIVFWIIGSLFLLVGLIVCVPTFMKFSKCKGHTTGKIIGIENSSNNARAIYEYRIGGNSYTNKTNWTSNCIFTVGGDCHVLYCEKDPNCSYIKMSGQYIPLHRGYTFCNSWNCDIDTGRIFKQRPVIQIPACGS